MMKQKTIVSNGDNLPPEILADILSRLSVKSLCQFKCVESSWNSLISSPFFAKTHLKRNPSKKIVLFCDSEDLYSVDFAAAKKLEFPSVQYSHKWVKVMGSCNGLLLVCDQGHSEFVLNPSTREGKKLPSCPLSTPHLSSEPYVYLHGFGYDSSRDDYKVVMLPHKYIKSDSKSYCDGDTNNTYAFVYSLKTDAWRRIQGFHYHPLGYFSGVFFDGSPRRLPSGVYFNERLHWLCRRTGGSDGSFVIVAFDSSDEIFREVQLPTLFSYSEILYHCMIVLGGYLCVVVLPSSLQYEVWMMKDYGVRDSWTKFMTNPKMVLKDLLRLLAKDKFWLKTTGNVDEVCQDKLVVYKSKKKTLREVARRISPKCQYGGTYVESLVSPNHGGGIGRQ